MSTEKAYQISAWKAASIVGGAVLVSVVGTAFTIFGVINTDHFTLVGIGHRVSALEQTTTPRTELTIQFEAINERLDRQELKIDKLLER